MHIETDTHKPYQHHRNSIHKPVWFFSIHLLKYFGVVLFGCSVFIMMIISSNMFRVHLKSCVFHTCSLFPSHFYHKLLIIRTCISGNSFRAFVIILRCIEFLMENHVRLVNGIDAVEGRETRCGGVFRLNRILHIKHQISFSYLFFVVFNE